MAQRAWFLPPYPTLKPWGVFCWGVQVVSLRTPLPHYHSLSPPCPHPILLLLRVPKYFAALRYGDKHKPRLIHKPVNFSYETQDLFDFTY